MFAECVTTRRSVDADGGFIMRKAVVTTARALLAAGAAGMLGIAMLAAPTAARASSGGCTSSSPCSLVFTTDGQPAATAADATITSSVGSQGGPVKVEVVDQFQNPVTNSKAAITLAITANPGSGKLSGTTTVSAVRGVASFSDLSINKTGFGYTLTATSRGMSAATSAGFNIWFSLQKCTAASCSASQALGATTGTVSTSSATGQFLGIGVGAGGVSYTCGGTYQPVSEPVSFEVLSTTGPGQSAQFTVALRIDKSKVQSSGHPGASTWQICYAAPTTSPFASQPGTEGPPATIGGVVFNTGLLTDCSSTQGSPCVQARTKDNAGDVIVTFLASGDPIGKG
jgi:hypothetical protein